MVKIGKNFLKLTEKKSFIKFFFNISKKNFEWKIQGFLNKNGNILCKNRTFLFLKKKSTKSPFLRINPSNAHVQKALPLNNRLKIPQNGMNPPFGHTVYIPASMKKNERIVSLQFQYLSYYIFAKEKKIYTVYTKAIY